MRYFPLSHYSLYLTSKDNRKQNGSLMLTEPLRRNSQHQWQQHHPAPSARTEPSFMAALHLDYLHSSCRTCYLHFSPFLENSAHFAGGLCVFDVYVNMCVVCQRVSLRWVASVCMRAWVSGVCGGCYVRVGG